MKIKPQPRYKFDLDLIGDEKYLIGIDEVGWGCVAGELVLGGALVPKELYFKPYEFLNEVRDSKKLSKKKRQSLIENINQQSQIKFAIGAASVELINEKGLAHAYTHAINQILTQFAEYLTESKILIDGNRNPKTSLITKYELIIKGDDQSLAIGIASNIAKEFRDNSMILMDAKYPGYDFHNNVGYGTPKHKQGLLSFGLTPIHRIEPSKKLIS